MTTLGDYELEDDLADAVVKVANAAHIEPTQLVDQAVRREVGRILVDQLLDVERSDMTSEEALRLVCSAD